MYLHFQINKSPDLIFDYLTDMQKFVTVHPIIFRIDKLNSDEYMIHEKLKMLGIPMVFKYKATVNGNPEKGEVNIAAKVMGMINIRMQFIIKSINNHTEVYETVVFKTLLPVKWKLGQIFREQHGQLFKNLQSI